MGKELAKGLISDVVAVDVDEKRLHYPLSPPFSPHERYPEYPFDHLAEEVNPVYASIRNLFAGLGYDKSNFGKRSWNPLKGFVSPGGGVVIKPNWVFHQSASGSDSTGMVTHSSLIRAVLDYVIIALEGKGVIVIGDAPIQSADFSKLLENAQMESVLSFFKGRTETDIRIEDFRREISIWKGGLVFDRVSRDEGNCIEVNLGDRSHLVPISGGFGNFRVTNYDKDKMLRYHDIRDHIYVIDKNILEADLVVSMPKLKSHRKAGLTCCLKNSVGINCQKDCLPHHRKGSKEEGGDAYEKASLIKRVKEDLFERLDRAESVSAQRIYKTCLRITNKLASVLSAAGDIEGSWYGNDTVWRTILDINRILFYADRAGKICDTHQRKVLYVVDGVVAGEREGPLEPTNRHFGLLAAGDNPVALDLVVAKLVGFDSSKIPLLSKATGDSLLWDPEVKIDDIPVVLDGEKKLPLKDLPWNFHLKPSKGWLGHIERV